MDSPKSLSSMLMRICYALRTLVIVIFSGICFISMLCIPVFCLMMIDRCRSFDKLITFKRNQDEAFDNQSNCDIGYRRFSGGINDSAV